MNQPSLEAQLVEYEAGGELWRCGAFHDLVVEFEDPAGGPLTVAELPAFHRAAAMRDRGWRVVRRLFGIWPVLPGPDADQDDLRQWSREELRENMGLTRQELQAEVDGIRGAWKGVRSAERGVRSDKKPNGTAADLPAAVQNPEPQGKLQFSGDEILARYGFNLRFDSVEMGAQFAGRVHDYEKLLKERLTAGLARATLMTELQIWQMDEFMANPEKARMGSDDWRKNMKVLGDLRESYRKQIEQIDALAPWASAITGKNAFAAVLSTVTQAMQEYAAKGETRLVDGFLTAFEFRVEMRRSVQNPDPRYRLGLAMYVAAARAGLWDPNWQCPFEDAELKRYDRAFAASLKESEADAGKALPDLLKEERYEEHPTSNLQHPEKPA